MSKLTLLAAAMALASFAEIHAQSAAAEKETAQLMADCNVVADSRSAKRKNMRACETLAMEGRLSLVEPAAQAAYQQYREEQRQACLRRQASPRGQSRGQSDPKAVCGNGT
jgi:hypothetical protein